MRLEEDGFPSLSSRNCRSEVTLVDTCNQEPDIVLSGHPGDIRDHSAVLMPPNPCGTNDHGTAAGEPLQDSIKGLEAIGPVQVLREKTTSP